MVTQNVSGQYIPRLLEEKLRASMDKNVITMIAGARQVGKSTLLSKVMEWVKSRVNGQEAQEGVVFSRKVFSYTLDDIQLRTSLKKDIAFIERDIQLSLGTTLDRYNGRIFVFIDEVQKFPKILDWIKQVYDKAPQTVKFFITGSSVAGFNEKLTETLAGRIEYLHLYPINYRELLEYRKGVTVSWFQGFLNSLQTKNAGEGDILSQLNTEQKEDHADLASVLEESLREAYVALSTDKRETAAIALESMFYGGLPKIFNVPLQERIEIIRNYVSVYLEKEVGFISRNLDLELFGLSLSAFAKQSGELLNIQKVSKEVGVARPSLYRYLDLLENTFLIKRIYPYAPGETGDKGATKSVTLNYVDPGLVNVLAGINSVADLFRDNNSVLRAYRSFVLNMLFGYFEFLSNPPHMHYWADYEGHRVDFIFDYEGVTVGFLLQIDNDPRKVSKTKEKFVQLAKQNTVVLIEPTFNFPSDLLEYEVKEQKIKGKRVIEIKVSAQLVV